MSKNISNQIKKLNNNLSDNVRKKLATKTARKEMLLKYGDRAFLDSDALRYPVIDPYTGEFDCNLITLAYFNSQARKDSTVTLKAKNLFKQNKCTVKTSIQLESAENIVIKHHQDKPIYMAPEKTTLDIYSQNRGQLRKNINQCICSDCGFECPLSLDIPSCDKQTCPICGNKMKTLEIANESAEQETLKSMINEVFEKDLNEGGEEAKFICNNCQTIVDYSIKQQYENHCPKCENELTLLREVLIEKRNYCPKCNTSYKYEGINENNVCTVCGKYTLINEQLRINKKSKSQIPFNSV
jgi:hypothetical protein